MNEAGQELLGFWACAVCTLRNDSWDTLCDACGTAKPATVSVSIKDSGLDLSDISFAITHDEEEVVVNATTNKVSRLVLFA